MVPSSLFILASSVCKSLQCLISTLTQGGEGGHLFRLTCSVVLWGGRSPADKSHWRVWGAHSVWATLSLPPLMACVLSLSTLPRFQVALQGNCLKQALGCMHFPGISCSGSVLGYPTKAQARLGLCFVPFPGLRSFGDQVLGENTLPAGRSVLSPPRPSPSVSRVHRKSTVSDVLCVSSGELISGCDAPGRCQLSRIPGRRG